jgi:hypothetical protein
MSELADIKKVPDDSVDERYELKCEGQLIKGIVKNSLGSVVVIGATGYGNGLLTDIEPYKVREKMLEVEKRIKADSAMSRGA